MKFIIVILWLVCGFWAWGITLAADRHDHYGYESIDCRHDQAFSSIWGMVAGPVALGTTLAFNGFGEYGVQWTCPDPVRQRN
jgi:hypothetical protein